MELAALALVNVLSALAMYLFFSMRFTRAIEEQRKLPLTRELKDNIRLAIEFINSSVDLMDQKSRTFYQMVRRAEELTARLEEFSALERESAATPKKRRARKANDAAQAALLAAPASEARGRAAGETAEPETGPVRESARESARAPSSRRPAPATPATPAIPATPAPSATPAAARPAGPARPSPYASVNAHAGREDSYDVERALDRLGADRLDITPAAPNVDAAFRSGELSRTAERFADTQPGDVLSGFLGRIGGAVRRTLGLESSLTGLNYEDVVRAARAARTVGEKSAASPPPAGGQATERPRFVIPETPQAPTLEARPPRRAPAEERPRDLLPRLDRFESGGPAFSAEPESLYGPQRTRSDARAARAPEADDASDPLLDALETALQRGELRNFVLTERSQRTQVLRALLSYGYRPEEISAETGVGLAEIELAAALPAGGRRPRKQRLLDPDR